MKVLAGILLLAMGAAFAEPALPPFPAPPSSVVGRMSEVLSQVQDGLSDLPADVSRIAVHQIRFDPSEFRPGEMRYLQARIEEAFSRQGRRTVVNSPELRTLRVISTDTSLSVSNTLPGIDDLARLGEKLHVDAFVDGSCSRSPDGDLLLALRVFRARTGELVWSRSQVSGPSRAEAQHREIDVAVSLPFRVLPVGQTTTGNRKFSDTWFASGIAADVAVTEIVNTDRWLALSVLGGYAHMGLAGLPDSISPPDLHILHIGVEAMGIFFRKSDPREGYWLGAYAGFQEMIPLLQRENFGTLRLGYRTKPTRHFSLSAGVVAVLFGQHMVDASSTSSSQRVFDLDRIGYELNILHYTF